MADRIKGGSLHPTAEGHSHIADFVYCAAREKLFGAKCEKHPVLLRSLQKERTIFESSVKSSFVAMKQAGKLFDDVDEAQAATGFLCLFLGTIDKYFLHQAEFEIGRDGRTFVQYYLRGICNQYEPTI